MRYLLPLLLALLTLSASTAMADEEVETAVATLAGTTYSCDLSGPDDGAVFASGCFVFDATPNEHGQAVALLTVPSPYGDLVGRWVCSYGASRPEEIVQCYGYGVTGYYFTGTASGLLKREPADGEPELLLDTSGITGAQIGTVGVARCYVDPACLPE